VLESPVAAAPQRERRNPRLIVALGVSTDQWTAYGNGRLSSMTVVITLNYSTSPAIITQAARDVVDQIFRDCFEDRDIVINWSPGLAPKNKLGNNATWLPSIPASEWNINIDTTLGAGLGANGQSGSYSTNLCPANIASSVTTGSGNSDATTANTIAHEVGVHILAGNWFHFCSEETDDVVDGPKCTILNTRVRGRFSKSCCQDIINSVDPED
jgi:hypothetical protein